jgi:soluble lytic murein transglycosylase-like protein
VGQTTVIDQLIVALKLDPRDFQKGEKQVAASMLKAKRDVKSATDEMSRGAENAARSFSNAGGVIGNLFSRGGAIGLALAVAVAAGKKINDMLYEVAENTRRLGLDARAYNVSASGLRNMQNAAELAGGSLEDANASAASLAKSLFDLKFNGNISDQLIQLGRIGVQFQDSTGKARDLKDVTLDTASALERLQKAGTMSQSDAIQFATQAGFTGGMAQLVASGRGATEAALARQEGRRQVGAGDVGAATDRVNAFVSLGQAAVAEAGVPLMAKESPMMTKLSQTTERGLTGGAGLVGDVGEKLSGAIDTASMALGDLADNAKRAGQSFGNAVGAQGAWMRSKIYGPAIDAAADKYGIDRDVLRGIARTESGFDPSAVSKKGAKGIMQLMPQFFPNAGKNPYDDIDAAAKHFAGLLANNEGTEQERYIQALREYQAGETNVARGTNLGPENRAYAAKVLRGTGFAMPTPNAQAANVAGGNRTDITFESVTINAKGNDGRTIANEFVDTSRRKLMAAQADTGMQ